MIITRDEQDGSFKNWEKKKKRSWKILNDRFNDAVFKWLINRLIKKLKRIDSL